MILVTNLKQIFIWSILWGPLQNTSSYHEPTKTWLPWAILFSGWLKLKKKIIFLVLKFKWFDNRLFAHFRLILKLYALHILFHFKVKGSPFMQGSMKITYLFPHNLFKILMLEQLVNFLFTIKLSSGYLQGSNIYNLWENYTRLCCPFHCSY